jgi:hypothetical protein
MEVKRGRKTHTKNDRMNGYLGGEFLRPLSRGEFELAEIALKLLRDVRHQRVSYKFKKRVRSELQFSSGCQSQSSSCSVHMVSKNSRSQSFDRPFQLALYYRYVVFSKGDDIIFG